HRQAERQSTAQRSVYQAGLSALYDDHTRCLLSGGHGGNSPAALRAGAGVGLCRFCLCPRRFVFLPPAGGTGVCHLSAFTGPAGHGYNGVLAGKVTPGPGRLIPLTACWWLAVCAARAAGGGGTTAGPAPGTDRWRVRSSRFSATTRN